MIALLTACLFFEILNCARANLHQQKRALKLCSATLSIQNTNAIGVFMEPSSAAIRQNKNFVISKSLQCDALCKKTGKFMLQK